MELFPSTDDEQWEFIKREIDSSDYYVVVVAGKYGSLAPDGQGFTEKEYDYAVSLGKPAMGFLAKDLSELKGLRLEEDPAKKLQLRTFREKVSRGKLVKFYANPDELKAQVMQALMHSFQMRPQEGWTRARNASRTEDLSKIINLQERVRELEAKLAEPRVVQEDPSAPFDRGDEMFEWLFPLESGSIEFMFTVTWNEVLLLFFHMGLSDQPSRALRGELTRYSVTDWPPRRMGVRGLSQTILTVSGLS
jgi:hypothetical protein